MKTGHENHNVVRVSGKFTQSGRVYEAREYQATGNLSSGMAEFKVRTKCGRELTEWVEYPQKAPVII